MSFRLVEHGSAKLAPVAQREFQILQTIRKNFEIF